MIPTWLWEDGPAEDDLAALDGDGDVEDLAAFLGSLSSEPRLAILSTLAAADGPLSHSALRERTGIADKGRLNYHLRELEGEFLADGADGYRLTARGEDVLADLLAYAGGE